MTAVVAQVPGQAPLRSGLRLVRLHMASRRFLVALALLAACAAGLRGALYGHWDSYGALQLPLVFEAGCGAVITVMVGSPFGEPERATGRWLPFLRLGARPRSPGSRSARWPWPELARTCPAASRTCCAMWPG